MLVELSIVPLTGSSHLSDEIAQIVNIIEDSGLPYQLTPTGTCIEGEWDEVMDTVRQCHEYARSEASHVITTVKIDDDEEQAGKLEGNVRSVREKIGGDGMN